MAHLSGDEGLLTAFSEDRDIHQATAAEVFGMPLAAVTANQRRSAKAINFGLIYGMSRVRSRTTARHRTRRRHSNMSSSISSVIPGVRRYMEETRQHARERGFVETVFGRRLYLQRHRLAKRGTAPGRRARGDQCADARHGRRYHQASDDRRWIAG